jgi:hypothetical protein
MLLQRMYLSPSLFSGLGPGHPFLSFCVLVLPVQVLMESATSRMLSAVFRQSVYAYIYKNKPILHIRP